MHFERKGEYDTPFRHGLWPPWPFHWKCRYVAVSEEERKDGVVAYTASSGIIFRHFIWQQDNHNSRPTIQEVHGPKWEIPHGEWPRFAVSHKNCHTAVIVNNQKTLYLQVASVTTDFPTYCNYITKDDCNDEDSPRGEQSVAKPDLVDLAISSDPRYAVWSKDDGLLGIFRSCEGVEQNPPYPGSISKVEVVKDVAVLVYSNVAHFHVYRISFKPLKYLFYANIPRILSTATISSDTQYIAFAYYDGNDKDAGYIGLLELNATRDSYKQQNRVQKCGSRVRAMWFLADNNLVVVGEDKCYYYSCSFQNVEHKDPLPPALWQPAPALPLPRQLALGPPLLALGPLLIPPTQPEPVPALTQPALSPPPPTPPHFTLL
ncbi:hypothetical protein BU17DRAFT_61431 [Hysterangium stoloniferum]|nr:hypothetical protein BU17DRAFT_61431 [Hysterangium stoloniferum]